MPVKKLKTFLLILILAVVGFSVYINSLHGDFLIDDQQAIVQNQKIHDISTYFTKYFGIRQNELWNIAHVLLWHISKGDTFPFHLFSVIIQVICVILIFYLCRELFSDWRLAFFAGLIFAVHPIHTEVVSWISGCPYAFSSALFLLAFIFYIRADQSLKYLLLCVVFFVLCMFVGNCAVVFPLMALGYEIFFRPSAARKMRLTRLIALSLVIVTAVIFALTFILTRSKFTHIIFSFRGFNYVIVITKAFIYYLKILYMPIERGLYHPFAFSVEDVQRLSPAFFFSLIAIAVMITAFFKFRKGFKPLSFGIMWFLVAYLPYSNIIPICNIISERYLYLPSIGFCIVFSALLVKAWDTINLYKARLTPFLRVAFVCAVTLFVGSYTALTIKRNYEYKNIIIYWQSNIRNFKDGNFVYNILASTFYNLGDRDNAIAYCWINLLIDSQQPHVWCNLGKVYREQGEVNMAKNCYQEALKIDAKYYPAIKALEQIDKEKNKQK